MPQQTTNGSEPAIGNNYNILIQGCDDSTRFDVFLTDQEFQLMKVICEMSVATSTYGCMPTMSIAALNAETVKP